MSTAPAHTPGPSPGFPDEHALCEACGYPIKGLAPDKSCPECGTPVADSDPAQRTGLPWQVKPTAGQFARTTLMIARHPTATFRRMRLGRVTDKRHTTFTCMHAALIGALGAAVLMLADAKPPGAAAEAAFYAFFLLPVAVVLLALVESLGVTVVCRRRKWRVPWRTAFQVCCYASVGWWLTAIVGIKLVLVYHHSTALHDWLDTLYPWRDVVEASALIFLVGVSLLPYEILVWTGVRAVRYGNEPVQTADQSK